MEEYTPKYFKNSLPDWKKKKDSMLVRNVHRPLSFLTASLFCKLGMSANEVSLLSLAVGIMASVCYLVNRRGAFVAGSLLVNLFMVLDCTDGNIARSVKRERYGEFIDAICGYLMESMLFICMGIAGFKHDGLLFSAGSCWLLFIAALASVSDVMGRLVHQKFLNQENLEEGLKNFSKTSSVNESKIGKIQDRIDKEIGRDGLFLPFIILVSCVEWFDIFLLFYAAYYSLRMIGTTAVFVLKVFKINKAEV